MGKLRHGGMLGSDLLAYAVINRVWWIVPLMLILISVTLVVVVGQAAAPVTLYPMF